MSNTSKPWAAPDFDPFTQNFTLFRENGETIKTDLTEVDFLINYGVRLAINYGSQIGASIVLLLVLLLLTKREKRRSAIFIMNTICLVINIIRSVLQCRYLTGSYWSIYSQLAGDSSKDAVSDKANTVASNTMTLLLVICIMASLSMQVWVVCKTTPTLQRVAIMGITSALALVAIGYRFATAVIASHSAIIAKEMFSYHGLLNQMTIFQALAIWGYCVIFTLKLGYALVQRRKLGMTQFGPMQIVFIMGAQTMVIPAIFTILQFNKSIPELGSQTLTIVCIFLPLSAIWAGVVANDIQIAHSGAGAHQKLLLDHFGPSSPTASRTCNVTKGSTLDGTTIRGPDSPTTTCKKSHNSEDGGIYVDREWTVEKSQASSSNV